MPKIPLPEYPEYQPFAPVDTNSFNVPRPSNQDNNTDDLSGMRAATIVFDDTDYKARVFLVATHEKCGKVTKYNVFEYTGNEVGPLVEEGVGPNRLNQHYGIKESPVRSADLRVPPFVVFHEGRDGDIIFSSPFLDRALRSIEIFTCSEKESPIISGR